MTTYDCYFAGNSKPIEGGKMKYGIYIKSSNNEFKDSREYDADIRNNINVAEVMGLTHILKILQNKESSKINIYGDSILVMNQISGNFMHSNEITDNAKTLLNEISKKNIVNLYKISKEENSIANSIAIFEEDKIETPTDYVVLGGGNLSVNSLNGENHLNVSVNLNIPLKVFQNSKDNFINIINNEISNVKYVIGDSLVENANLIGIDFTKNSNRYSITSGGVRDYIESNLWNLFMKLAERAMTNRDEFFELYTETEFTETELDNITNLNMFDFYYDSSSSMYVFKLK